MSGKEKIIKAALKIFMIKGYAASSMSDVVVEAQLSKGAIYYHFKNKKDLFLQCIDFMFEEYERWKLETYSDSIDVKEILQTYLGSLAMIHEFVGHLTGTEETNIDDFYKLMMEGFSKFPEIKEKHNTTNESIMKRFNELLKIAQEDGVIKPELDCSFLGFMIIAIAEGTIVYHMLSKEIDLEIVGNKLFKTLWTGISTEKVN